jgi:hypothetical protein
MYNKQIKREMTLGKKKFMITVDHDRINSDPMFLKLKRGSMQRIHVHKE